MARPLSLCAGRYPSAGAAGAEQHQVVVVVEEAAAGKMAVEKVVQAGREDT